MAGFGHGPAATEVVDPQIAARNSKFGLRLFAIYFAFYVAYVGLNAFTPAIMGQPILGINLAVWYGMGLIGAALALALVYTWLCRSNSMITGKPTNPASGDVA